MLTINEIGNKIRSIREENGLSQLQLSEALKTKGLSISRETVSKIETGDRTISVIEIKAISEVLNISVEELLKEDEESDLVTLFRMRDYSDETIESVSYIQEVLKDFILQKELYEGKLKINKRVPAWRTK